MSYPEITIMGEGSKELEFQPWSARQKEDFIRRKLAQYKGEQTDTGYRELDIRLLHPEILTWEGLSGPSRLPPQHGMLADISPDIGLGGRRNRKKTIVVNFASTSNVTGVNMAQFGLGALEVTTGGEMVIDCSRLESPREEIQTAFPHPNTFIERSSFPTHKNPA